jgi:hypothetical protein
MDRKTSQGQSFDTVSHVVLFQQPVLVVEEAGNTQRESQTMGKQLVNFITCSCESSAPFFVIYNAGCEPRTHWFNISETVV